jgi:hypothetical protein
MEILANICRFGVNPGEGTSTILDMAAHGANIIWPEFHAASTSTLFQIFPNLHSTLNEELEISDPEKFS